MALRSLYCADCWCAIKKLLTRTHFTAFVR